MSLLDTIRNAFGGGQNANAVPQEIVMMTIQNMPGGLDGLLSKLHAGGMTNIVSSWHGPGENAPINPAQIQGALGEQHVQQIASQLGLPMDQTLSVLALHLPNIASQQTQH